MKHIAAAFALSFLSATADALASHRPAAFGIRNGSVLQTTVGAEDEQVLTRRDSFLETAKFASVIFAASTGCPAVASALPVDPTITTAQTELQTLIALTGNSNFSDWPYAASVMDTCTSALSIMKSDTAALPWWLRGLLPTYNAMFELNLGYAQTSIANQNRSQLNSDASVMEAAITGWTMQYAGI